MFSYVFFIPGIFLLFPVFFSFFTQQKYFKNIIFFCIILHLFQLLFFIFHPELITIRTFSFLFQQGSFLSDSFLFNSFFYFDYFSLFLSIGMSIVLLAVFFFTFSVESKIFFILVLLYAFTAISSLFALVPFDFLVYWELTTIFSSVLIIYEIKKDCFYSYILPQLFSSFLLIIAFALLEFKEGISVDLIEFFLFFSIGIKAGFPFLNIWINKVYPAVSYRVLMVLNVFSTKVGIFALVRFFLAYPPIYIVGFVLTSLNLFFSFFSRNRKDILVHILLTEIGLAMIMIGFGDKASLFFFLLQGLIFFNLLLVYSSFSEKKEQGYLVDNYLNVFTILILFLLFVPFSPIYFTEKTFEEILLLQNTSVQLLYYLKLLNYLLIFVIFTKIFYNEKEKCLNNIKTPIISVFIGENVSFYILFFSSLLQMVYLFIYVPDYLYVIGNIHYLLEHLLFCFILLIISFFFSRYSSLLAKKGKLLVIFSYFSEKKEVFIQKTILYSSHVISFCTQLGRETSFKEKGNLSSFSSVSTKLFFIFSLLGGCFFFLFFLFD